MFVIYVCLKYMMRSAVRSRVGATQRRNFFILIIKEMIISEFLHLDLRIHIQHIRSESKC